MGVRATPSMGGHMGRGEDNQVAHASIVVGQGCAEHWVGSTEGNEKVGVRMCGARAKMDTRRGWVVETQLGIAEKKDTMGNGSER